MGGIRSAERPWVVRTPALGGEVRTLQVRSQDEGIGAGQIGDARERALCLRERGGDEAEHLPRGPMPAVQIERGREVDVVLEGDAGAAMAVEVDEPRRDDRSAGASAPVHGASPSPT